MKLKIFLIDSTPKNVVDNLIRQGYVNIARALIPIEVSFPNVMNYAHARNERDMSRVKKEVQKTLSVIHSRLYSLEVVQAANHINNALRRYGLAVTPSKEV